MALTNLKVTKAKPKKKPYKLADERGMYLLVHPKVGKWWRLDYRFQENENPSLWGPCLMFLQKTQGKSGTTT